MVEQATETLEQTKPKHQMVLYDLCSRDFEMENIYAMGGLRPNARHIASQYECQLEFRWSKYRNTHPNTNFNLNRRSIADDGSCLSAILVGHDSDREKLAKARADIHRSYGVAPFTEGAIDISDKKTIFG